MIYDVKHGTEHGLRDFLFPVLRQTYDDLLARRHAARARRPAAAGRAQLRRAHRRRSHRHSLGQLCARAVVVFLCLRSAGAAAVSAARPRRQTRPGMGRVIKRLAPLHHAQMARPIYELRRELGLGRGPNPLFDAKHSPNLVLALFSRVLGVEQKDWPPNTLITGFCFYDADAGNAGLPPHLEEFLSAGRAARRLHARLRGGACCRRFLRSFSARGRSSSGCAPCCSSVRPAQPAAPPLPASICVAEYAPYSALFRARLAHRSPGRRGDHRAMPARRQADAHHALLARPARQRPPHAPPQSLAHHPEASYTPAPRCAQAEHSS